MDIIEFKSLRNSLHKTQKELAQLLGVSLKAVHSYEQGWRSIPTYTERQILPGRPEKEARGGVETLLDSEKVSS